MQNSRNPFRLNVGFLINQSVGTIREFEFDLPQASIPPDLDLNELTGFVRITRTAQGLLVRTRMQASIPAECVRCLDDFDLRLAVDFTELYAFSPKSVIDSENILPEDGYINLAPVLREYMLLEIPISPLCRPDCAGLCAVCGENLNETQCGHHTESIDPRLDILKSLLDDSG